MVTHDYQRGVISGLPRWVTDAVRRTGQLPADAMHPSMRAVWDGLAAQRAHESLPSLGVADILRIRDGWEEAFDPAAWERLTGGQVQMPAMPAPSTVGGGPVRGAPEEGKPAPESATAWMCACLDRPSAYIDSKCGDGDRGRVEEMQPWEAGVGDTSCTSSYVCRGGNLCSCWNSLTKNEVHAGGSECRESGPTGVDQGGVDPTYTPSCTYNAGTGLCECDVRCNNGSREDDHITLQVGGHQPCNPPTDRALSISQPICDRPDPVAADRATSGPAVTPPGCTADAVTTAFFFAKYYTDVRFEWKEHTDPLKKLLMIHGTERDVPHHRCAWGYFYTAADCRCERGPITSHGSDSYDSCRHVPVGVPRC